MYLALPPSVLSEKIKNQAKYEKETPIERLDHSHPIITFFCVSERHSIGGMNLPEKKKFTTLSLDHKICFGLPSDIFEHVCCCFRLRL